MERVYFAIDLKSFYASVECVERGLDPLTANLVVADQSRTEKTICLAVTPSLKARGLKGRCRLFEVVQKVREIEARTGRKLEYITAVPRMALYMEYSARIYGIYLNYFSPDDIHVYSIDEVFIDATSYLSLYHTDAQTLLRTVIKSVLAETGITATAGIAPNLYLCKVAMDIVAKHSPPDKNGVRVAELTVESYRKTLWEHRPITDFWRISRGTAARLERHGMRTMGDIALRSMQNEALIYKLFGIDAEILIDHAWGLDAPARCCITPTLMTRPGLWCGRWRKIWHRIWWQRTWLLSSSPSTSYMTRTALLSPVQTMDWCIWEAILHHCTG